RSQSAAARADGRGAGAGDGARGASSRSGARGDEQGQGARGEPAVSRPRADRGFWAKEKPMKSTLSTLGLLLSALTWVGCATTTPPELIDARTTYDRISSGPAAQTNPSGIYEAKKSLDRANREFAQHPNAPSTRDFAYLALRKAQLAETEANIAADLQQIQQAQARAQQGAADKTQRELARTRNQLTRAERQQQAEAERLAQANAELQSKNQQLEAERQARLEAEEVRGRLGNVAQVRDHQRGLAITLPA